MTKTKDPYGRTTSTVFRRKCKELKQSAKGGVCCICGKNIDRSLPVSYAHSNVYAEWAAYWSVEHEPALSEGGDLIKDIKGPAHQGCNSDLGRVLQAAQIADGVIERSRDW